MQDVVEEDDKDSSCLSSAQSCHTAVTQNSSNLTSFSQRFCVFVSLYLCLLSLSLLSLCDN